MLERYLTLPPDSFAKFLKTSESLVNDSPEKEAYRYSKVCLLCVNNPVRLNSVQSSKFIMRSQLDCYDHRLPGTGVFDLKTRACIAIRRDRLNWEAIQSSSVVFDCSSMAFRKMLVTKLSSSMENLRVSNENTMISFVQHFSSFSKFISAYLINNFEYMSRFQVRIGNMDGVFVAYHNTEKFFGFQYIPLTEMDERLFGSSLVGNRVFEKCVGLLEALADEIVGSFPGEVSEPFGFGQL
jgi:hypothetical protein